AAHFAGPACGPGTPCPGGRSRPPRGGAGSTRHRGATPSEAWFRSGTLPAEAASNGDFVTLSAAAAAGFSVIFAITASRARLKYSRLLATNSRDVRKPAR